MAPPRQYREEELLRFIEQYMERHVIPPTVREMAKALGLKSPSSAYKHLLRLRDDGRVSWDRYGYRSLVVRDSSEASHA